MTYVTPLEPQFFEKPQPASFRGAAQGFSPPWLLNYVGARYVFSGAIQWDTLAEYSRIGTIQRFPTLAQPSALAPLGQDRKIFRGQSETDTHYAERLRRFKRTWKFAGNAPTLLTELWNVLNPGASKIRYVANGTGPGGIRFADWWTIDGGGLQFERVTPSNWEWDGSVTDIRFWVIIYRPVIIPAIWGIPPYDWGDPALYWGLGYGDDRTWVIDSYNIIEQFKAAGSHMGPYPGYGGGLIVANEAYVSGPWGPDGPFYPGNPPGYPMPDGTFADPDSRPPGAIYLSGL